MDDVKLVIVSSIEPVIAEDADGEPFAYLTLTTPSGDSVNLLVQSVKMACQFSAALLNLADNIPA
jgi:hypothetical protein